MIKMIAQVVVDIKDKETKDSKVVLVVACII